MVAAVQPSSGQRHDRMGGNNNKSSNMAAPTQPGGVESDPLEITTGQRMVSAMAGSLLTSLLVTPLDVVRVRLQSQKPQAPPIDFARLATTTHTLTPAQTSELGVTACCREVFFMGNNAEFCIAAPQRPTTTTGMHSADCAVQEVQKKTYNSTFDGMRKIARNEGFTTLWRGLSPTLVMAIPANIIYFSGYEWLRHDSRSIFSKMNDDYSPLTAGSAARVLAATTVGPIELVRTRMQAASSSSNNHMLETFKDIRQMVTTHGYTSMWRGLTLTLWRDVPFSGLYWWGYEVINAKLKDIRDEHNGRLVDRAASRAQRRRRNHDNFTETFLDSFASGALSGAIASIITTPFDVGKTRTQVYRDGPSGTATSSQRHMMNLLWDIFKTEGIPGLWRGWIPRTLKVAPSCAIMISSYEVGKTVFKNTNERRRQQGDL